MSRRLAVIDSETDPFSVGEEEPRDVRPFLWVFYDENGPEVFWNDHEGFIDFLREQEAVVYAHNGGRFDFPFLYDGLEADDAIKLIHGIPAKIKYGKAELRDSLKLFPDSLDKFSKDRFDYSKMLATRRESFRDEIIQYGIRDCEEIYLALRHFEESYGRHLTIGGVSVHQFQEIEGVELDDEGPDHYDEFRPYYYGGRVEVFPGKVGKLAPKKIRAFDINSAYPWACTQEHPAGSFYIVHRGKLPKSKNRLRKCFARILAVSHGCLPFRTEKGSLLYPRDDEPRWYHATGWEIEAGLETRTLDIVKVGEVYEWEETWTASRFVEHFYSLKSESKRRRQDMRLTDNARKTAHREELFAKYLLNNLYGKLATNGSRFKDYELFEECHLVAALEEGYEFEGTMGRFIVVSKPAVRQPFYDIVPAASITGCVRAKLWRAICASKGVHYCDTDSLFVAGPTKLPQSRELGDWELEGTFDAGGFGGRKLYALHHSDAQEGTCYNCKHSKRRHETGHGGCDECDCRAFDEGWKTASKGARLSWQEIMRVCEGETVEWTSRVPTASVAHGRFFQQRRIRREGADFASPLSGAPELDEKRRQRAMAKLARKTKKELDWRDT